MTITLTTTETKLIATAATCADRAIRWPETLKGTPRNEIIKRLLAAGYAVIANGCVTITDAAAAATRASATSATTPNGGVGNMDEAMANFWRQAARWQQAQRDAEARRAAAAADAAFRAARDAREAETRRRQQEHAEADRRHNERMKRENAERAARRDAPHASRTPKAPRPGSKIETMISMMMRSQGATIDEIAAACGWQRHTVRGAMAGKLKQMGYEIAKRTAPGCATAYYIKPL